MNKQTYIVDSEGIVRYKEPAWVEAYADVNITYGALWIKDYGDYADVLEVTDLDGTCGAVGRVLVTEGSTGLYGRGVRECIDILKGALSCCGDAGEHRRLVDLDGMQAGSEGYKARRLDAWRALYSYRHGDREKETIIQVEDVSEQEMDQSDRENGLGSDWNPTVKVDGEAGLRAWLAERYGIEGLVDGLVDGSV